MNRLASIPKSTSAENGAEGRLSSIGIRCDGTRLAKERTSMHAFRLALPHLDATFVGSRYGYRSLAAAVRAAPTLNLVRGLRSLAPYTHVVEWDGAKVVQLTALGSESL